MIAALDPRFGDALARLPEYLSGHVLVSMTALALGLAISLPLAFASTRRPTLRRTLLAVASVVQTIPGLALLALFYPLLLALAALTERATQLRQHEALAKDVTDGKVIASNPITFIAPRADDATQTILVKATLQRRPPGIRVQQYVRARIIWTNEPTIAVPVVAVNRISGQYFIFVAEQGQGGALVAKQKPITVGDLVGDSYIVRSGVKEGEKVIVSNIQKLQDGAPVKPEA